MQMVHSPLGEALATFAGAAGPRVWRAGRAVAGARAGEPHRCAGRGGPARCAAGGLLSRGFCSICHPTNSPEKS